MATIDVAAESEVWAHGPFGGDCLLFKLAFLHTLAVLTAQSSWINQHPLPSAQVLALLPEDVPLGHVMPWLGSAIGHCTEQSRNMAVVKHLRRCVICC